MLLSASPTYGEKRSAADTDRKVVFVAEASAFAMLVFAHPGGPYSSTPDNI